MQAMHAHSSVAAGMKGATKAMAAINKVAHSVLYFKYIPCPYIVYVFLGHESYIWLGLFMIHIYEVYWRLYASNVVMQDNYFYRIWYMQDMYKNSRNLI